MGSALTENLTTLLWRLSEGGPPAILPGSLAKDHFGPEFEALLGRRLVVEHAPITEWATCDRCECSLDARPIQLVGNRVVAACPLNASLDTVLDSNDLRQFEIDAALLVGETAAQSQLKRNSELVSDGVWFLGIANRRAIFAAPFSSSCQSPAIIQTLRRWAGGDPITVVGADCPASERQRFADSEIYWLAIRNILSDPKRPFSLDLAQLTPPATVEARLVLDRGDKSATLDGVRCMLSPHSFELLWLLAKAATSDGHVVSRNEIEKALWPATASTMSKTAAADAIRGLRRRLEDGRGNKLPASNLIATRQGQGYQLDLSAGEIRMID
jgi:DNA-binding winged helix-turn-helix (wHTH) protein